MMMRRSCFLLVCGLIQGFAKRWTPILNEFEKQDVNFALEVHPTEIAFDTASAHRAVEAVKGHKRFGLHLGEAVTIGSNVFVESLLDEGKIRVRKIFNSSAECIDARDGRLREEGQRLVSPPTGSLAVSGEFVHHLRWPWGIDKSTWREDQHELCGSPSIAPYEETRDPITPESLLPVKLSDSQVRDLIVVGAGPAGLHPLPHHPS
jgi:hypothetical protein